MTGSKATGKISLANIWGKSEFFLSYTENQRALPVFVTSSIWGKQCFGLGGQTKCFWKLVDWMLLSEKIYCKTLKVTIKAMQSLGLPGRETIHRGLEDEHIVPTKAEVFRITFPTISNHHRLRDYICYSAWEMQPVSLKKKVSVIASIAVTVTIWNLPRYEVFSQIIFSHELSGATYFIF